MPFEVNLRELGPYSYLLLYLMIEKNICTRKGLKKVCEGGNSILNDESISENLFDKIYRRVMKLSLGDVIEGDKGSYKIKKEYVKEVLTVLSEKREVYEMFLKD